MREGLEWFLGVMVGLVGVAGREEPLLRFEGLHGTAHGGSTSTCVSGGTGGGELVATCRFSELDHHYLQLQS